jgi:Flp pilus assembly protein CpaB
MRSKSTLVALLVSLAFTALGIGSYLLHGSIFSDKPALPVEPAVRMVAVVVAKKSLPMGTLIKTPEKYFEVRSLPEDGVPSDACADLEKIRGFKLMKPVSEDAVLTKSLLLDKRTSPLDNVPPGDVVIPVNFNVGYPFGFIPPLTRIDVLWRFGEDEDDDRTLVKNALILEMDGQAIRDSEPPFILRQKATLAVKPLDALKLSIAALYGQFIMSCPRVEGATTVHVDWKTILVARRPLEVGLRIDDPDKYFKKRETADHTPENAVIFFGRKSEQDAKIWEVIKDRCLSQPSRKAPCSTGTTCCRADKNRLPRGSPRATER